MMNRIVWHHTGGSHAPSPLDLEHYHFATDGEGETHKGKFDVLDNFPGKALKKGGYAAHTRGLNTGSIGHAMAAMAGAQWDRPQSTKFPPTQKQIKAFVTFSAGLCHEWRVPVSRENTLSHAEVEITLGVEQNGKWDFDYDLFGLNLSRNPIEVGDVFRSLVSQALRSLPSNPLPPPPKLGPVLKRGSFGVSVKELQLLLDLKPDGLFGPATWKAVVAFQTRNSLRPDGVVGPMTWAALKREAT